MNKGGMYAMNNKNKIQRVHFERIVSTQDYAKEKRAAGIPLIVTAECLKAAGQKGSIGIFVGPEGGFCEDEVAQCKEHGAECLSLGKRILRTETAGLAMLSMLMLAIECNEQ